MKVARIFTSLLSLSALTFGLHNAIAADSHSVRGHVRKDGTFVERHRQTNPNGTKSDNWSTKGNSNPYSGKSGAVDPYAPRRPKRPKR